ncbi:MAG: hypothetical protein R3255_05890 [Candidatus Lokiarchaeia archaeon]|nr:hypothetical protein [Candidatus Lokiarchaeia archaeon]
MVNLKENLWIILICAGILGIISLFTPTLYISSETASIWVWNLYVSSSSVGFVQTEEILYTLGVIATSFLAIGTLITLFSGIILKVREKRLNLIALIGGILILIGPIIYLGGISAEANIWDYYSVNIGSILPFFAGGIALLIGLMGLIKRK